MGLHCKGLRGWGAGKGGEKFRLGTDYEARSEVSRAE